MIITEDKLYYSKTGKHVKGIVVFLHGFLGSSKIWEELTPSFTDEYLILNIDLPGHGKSGFIQDTLEMSFCAEKVLEVLEKENVISAHIVGHSMGGYVGLEMLNRQPNVVDSLTLLNSTATADSPQKMKDRLLAVKVFDRSPEVFIHAAIENLFYKPNLKRFKTDVESLQAIALQTPIKGAQASLRGMRLRANHIELIKVNAKRIHFIAGKFDNTVLYDSILNQTKGTEITLTSLESGHMGFVESFEESTNAMIKFIKLNS